MDDGRNIDDGGVAQGPDNGKGQNGLGNNHSRRGVEQTHESQRSASGKKEVDKKADHYRRQAHEGVEQGDDDSPAGEAFQPQKGGCRQGQKGGDNQGQPGDLQG